MTILVTDAHVPERASFKATMVTPGQLIEGRVAFASEGWTLEENLYCCLLYQLVRQKSYTACEENVLICRYSIHENLLQLILPLFRCRIYEFSRRTDRAIEHRLRDMLKMNLPQLTLEQCVHDILAYSQQDVARRKTGLEIEHDELWITARWLERISLGEVSTCALYTEELDHPGGQLEPNIKDFRKWGSKEYDSISSALSPSPSRFRLLSMLRQTTRCSTMPPVYTETELAHLEVLIFICRQPNILYSEDKLPQSSFELRERMFGEMFRRYQELWPVFHRCNESNVRRRANGLHRDSKLDESLNLERIVRRICSLHACPRLFDDVFREVLLFRAVTLGSARALAKLVKYCDETVESARVFEVRRKTFFYLSGLNMTHSGDGHRWIGFTT